MDQQFHPEIFHLEAERAKRNMGRGQAPGADDMGRIITHLRHVHVPVVLYVIRANGRDADTAKLLLRPSLRRLGVMETMANGDICLMCINNSVPGRFVSDAPIKSVTQAISRELAIYRRRGMTVRCHLAFFHFWSDEFTAVPDLINVARLSHNGMVEIDDTMTGAVPCDGLNF